MHTGVPVTATRYLGTIDYFMKLNVITNRPAVRGAIDQSFEMLKKPLTAQYQSIFIFFRLVTFTMHIFATLKIRFP